jgi:hypothetical protein
MLSTASDAAIAMNPSARQKDGAERNAKMTIDECNAPYRPTDTAAPCGRQRPVAARKTTMHAIPRKCRP